MSGLIPGSDILLAVAACSDEPATLKRLAAHLNRRSDNLKRSLQIAVTEGALSFDGETCELTEKGRRIVQAERLAAGEDLPPLGGDRPQSGQRGARAATPSAEPPSSPSATLPPEGADLAAGAARGVSGVVVLRWDEIEEDPANPRTNLDSDEEREAIEQLRSLVVQRRELLQPVQVRPRGDTGKHRLVFGHRRWRAVGRAIEDADLPADFPIPATVRDYSDAEALVAAVEENVARRDMHPLDEAEAYRKLVRDHGWSTQDVADRFEVGLKTVQDRIGVAERLDDATRARMRLPADDPEHLTYKAARQRLRDQGAAEAVSGIVLTAAAKLALLELFAKAALEPDRLVPLNGGMTRYAAIYRANGGDILLVELSRAKLIAFDDTDASLAKVTRLGERWLEHHSLVDFSGAVATWSPTKERDERWATPWLNPPEPKTAATGTARPEAAAERPPAPAAHGETEAERAGGSTAAARKRARAAAEMLTPAERLILAELAHRIRRYGRMVTRPPLGVHSAEYARAVPSRAALADLATWTLSQPDRPFIFNWSHYSDRARTVGEDVSALTPLAQRALSHFAPALANIDRPDAQADAELLEAVEQAGHDPKQYLLGDWYLTGWLNARWRDEIIPAKAPASPPPSVEGANAAAPVAGEPGSPIEPGPYFDDLEDIADDAARVFASGVEAQLNVWLEDGRDWRKADQIDVLDGLRAALLKGDLCEAGAWLAVLNRYHHASSGAVACALFGAEGFEAVHGRPPSDPSEPSTQETA